MIKTENVRSINESPHFPTERPVGAIVNELKDEGRDFVSTRIAMLVSEMRENLSEWKSAFPTVVTGAIFALTAWFVLTVALISAIWVAFAGNALAIVFACLIVGCSYLLLGGLLLFFGLRKLREKTLLPKRTIRVLREDSLWLQQEAKTHL